MNSISVGVALSGNIHIDATAGGNGNGGNINKTSKGVDMAQALLKVFTFEEFIEWLPENTGKR